MKKTLSLLLALVMVISLFPGFADERPTLTAEEAGSVLKGYGAIKGDSKGDLMIDKELKRQDAVVILTRLMGKEADALATQAAPSFEDITIDYYKPFLAFAEANKWVEGKAEKKFGFNDVVTVKEFTAMLLRALGHDTMGDNYAKVMDLAKEQGLLQGVMAEEAAPVIRGVAFIMMNNTLETAPKGEDKALVYKLGYKEVPKPENLTVISAEAQGLKAIDVKFSKAVSEKSLKGISVKDGSKKVTFEPALVDEMTVRLVLNTVATQDAKYMVTVDGVKSADMMETVEKFEAAVFMTDATRPEVMSVEALNPKTLLVKVSEPMDFDKPSFATLANFKIDGKSLVARATSDKEKNEVLVELYTALKAGDYKLEVSGLKDFAGFVAKTQEFDITVVEDKDAPVATEATMVNLNTVKVVFNEPLSQKGQFKVNGNPVSSVLEKDKKTVTLTLAAGNELGMSAVVEVKVEYKDQKDIMGNMVKDWTKLTFKVEDDTTLPEVKSVELDKTDIVVTFTKNMDTTKGSYTLKKADKVVIAKTSANGKFKADDAAVLVIDAKSVLNNAQAATYTLILEGFVDGTVRKNEMPKSEQTITAGDTEAPKVLGNKSEKKANDFLVVQIYFNEEMDEATLLEAKNYTLEDYELEDGTKTTKRADMADVTLKADNAGKTLVITATDKNVKNIKTVKIVGLKDRAGNMMAATDVNTVDVSAIVPQNATAEFMKKDDKFVIEVKFTNSIAYMGDAYKLVGKDGKDLNLTLAAPSVDNKTYVYNFDQDMVTSDVKHDGAQLKLERLNDGKNALDIYDQAATAINTITDKAAPALMKDKDNKPVVTFKDDYTQIKVSFDEEVDPATTNVVLTDEDGASVNLAGLAVDTDKSILIIEKNDSSQFKNGTYKLTLQKVSDVVAPTANATTELGTIDVKVAAPVITLKPAFTAVKAQNTVTLSFDQAYAVADKGIDPATTIAYTDAEVRADFTVTVNDGDRTATNVDLSVAGKIKVTFGGAALAGNDKVKVTFKEGKLVDKVNPSVNIKTVTFDEVTVAP